MNFENHNWNRDEAGQEYEVNDFGGEIESYPEPNKNWSKEKSQRINERQFLNNKQ